MLKTRKLLRRGLIIDGTNKGTCLQATKYWTAIDFSLKVIRLRIKGDPHPDRRPRNMQN